MNTTQIKRLYQSNEEFVPITISEAVVVNTSGMSGLTSLGITTLDKVLKVLLGITGTNAGDIDKLEKLIETINNTLTKKQDKLTPGTGITITPDGVISANYKAELYKIVTSLPTPSKECTSLIYLLLDNKGIEGNFFKEFICIKSQNSGVYSWEQIGTVSTDIDLSGYVTKQEFTKEISTIKDSIKNVITAQNVTTSTGKLVKVNYTIPPTLYDDIINI